MHKIQQIKFKQERDEENLRRKASKSRSKSRENGYRAEHMQKAQQHQRNGKQPKKQAPSLPQRGPEEVEPQKALFFKFNQEYIGMMTTYEDEERPLVLLDALLHLGFVHKSCAALRSMRTSNKNILLTGKEMSPVIQENLYKLLCAVLNCVPTQQQGGPFDDNLLVTYLDQVHETESTEEHFFGVIKNLINRPAFQLTEIQTYLISTKFQKLNHNYQRKDAIRESYRER